MCIRDRYQRRVHGHFLYMDRHCDCSDKAPALVGLLLAFLIMGYIFLCIPTMSFVWNCFCHPLLACIWWICLRPRPVNPLEIMMKRLPAIKFSKNRLEAVECAICTTEYKEGDEVICLNCSNTHVFHAGCLRQWLTTGINPTCPICRGPIKGITEEFQNNNNNREEDQAPFQSQANIHLHCFHSKVLQVS
eukprot:TRINITY_DN20011_c0_g1_i1.p1 TRINITY_DN20011_c0_g1~~TRINITY_DN20011_c0_g1_i1.p1  ORF type:complete len:210 (-),score=30.09 TRINITY_DN20011_c0_g1_i1:93-662(-)